MKGKQVLFLVAIALICGGIAGYGSARLADGGRDQTIAAVRQLRFLDSSGNHQITLEFGGGRRPCLVLKDSTGRLLHDLPPSVKVQPVTGKALEGLPMSMDYRLREHTLLKTAGVI